MSKRAREGEAIIPSAFLFLEGGMDMMGIMGFVGLFGLVDCLARVDGGDQDGRMGGVSEA